MKNREGRGQLLTCPDREIKGDLISRGEKACEGVENSCTDFVHHKNWPTKP